MISSVATGLCLYESRISCCLASSRENTISFLSFPISFVRRRRTSVLPRDPVPPVINTDLPSSTVARSATISIPQRFVRDGPQRRDVKQGNASDLGASRREILNNRPHARPSIVATTKPLVWSGVSRHPHDHLFPRRGNEVRFVLIPLRAQTSITANRVERLEGNAGLEQAVDE